MNTKSNTKVYLFFTAALFIYFFPFFIFGKYTVVPIVDNLDCYYVWNKITSQPKYIFAGPSTIIHEYMNGLPKFTLLNCFSVFYLLNLLLPSFYAVALHIMLIHSVACISMYLLTSKYLFPESKSSAVIAALIYGLQKCSYAYGLSFALLPVVIDVLIRMYYNRHEKKDWTFIALYPFLSNFPSVGVFVVFIWGIASIYYFIKTKNINSNILIAASLMCILYYLNNFSTINNLLFNTYFISHRSDFKNITTQAVAAKEVSFNLKNILQLIFKFKLIFLGGFVLYKMYKKKYHSLSIYLISVVTVLFFILGDIFEDNWITDILKSHFLVFKMFHFTKILTFQFFFNSVFYALSFDYVFSIYKNRFFRYGLISAVLMFFCTQSLQWRPVLGISYKNYGRSFEGYYSPELFEKIKTSIGLPTDQYKVASFGINPAAAQYNGMYTVDGYINNYPIEYKIKFRKIITEDLDIIHKNIGYNECDFETWGHRCYLQNEDVVRYGLNFLLIDKINPLKGPQTVHWNFNSLKELGCNYIISSVEIKTVSQNEISLVNRFENNYYYLYLYKIK